MKRFLKLACFLVFCLLVFSVDPPEREEDIIPPQKLAQIENILSILSPKERKDLEGLFKFFDFFSGAPYTFFGSKPMSLGRLLPTKDHQDGWLAWEKIAPHFRPDRYIIRKHLFNGHEFVHFVDTKKIECVYLRSQARFKDADENQISLETLLSSLRYETPLFQNLIHNHLLLGILLGYGEHNAELFARNQQLPLQKRVPMSDFAPMHIIFIAMTPVPPLGFMCDPNTDETRELKMRYSEERRHILQLAKRKKLFINMLAKLLEDKE